MISFQASEPQSSESAAWEEEEEEDVSDERVRDGGGNDDDPGDGDDVWFVIHGCCVEVYSLACCYWSGLPGSCDLDSVAGLSVSGLASSSVAPGGMDSQAPRKKTGLASAEPSGPGRKADTAQDPKELCCDWTPSE